MLKQLSQKSLLFNLTQILGRKYSQSWKIANVISILKPVKNPSLIESYRLYQSLKRGEDIPLEKEVITQKIIHGMLSETNTILNYQFGFRKLLNY